jgi:hypothetical protein
MNNLWQTSFAPAGYYKSAPDSRIIQVKTSSSEPEDMIRSHLVEEIHNIRGLRQDLRTKYPALFNNVA